MVLETSFMCFRTQFSCECPQKKNDVSLTVHLSINLVNDQIDAQFFYFIIRFLQSPTCLEQSRAHHQEVKLY